MAFLAAIQGYLAAKKIPLCHTKQWYTTTIKKMQHGPSAGWFYPEQQGIQHVWGNKKQAHKTAFGKSYDEITWGICTYCEQRNKEIHFKEKGCENQDWIIVAQEEALCIICNHRGEALGFTTAEEISYSTESATHSMLFVCSEKTLRMNSPSSLGSNVDGTMQYTPGGNLKRQLTSRRLTKYVDCATDALKLKKFRSSGFGRFSGSCNCHRETHGASLTFSLISMLH